MERKGLFNFKNISVNYSKLINEIGAGKSCSIFGVQNSMRPALSSSFGKKIFYVTADNVSAMSALEKFSFMGLKTDIFPCISDQFIYRKLTSNELYLKRSKTLFDILTGDYDVIVATAESLLYHLPDVSEFKKHIVSLKAGQIIEQSDLEQLLVESGYKKTELIYSQGQFSKRGEIIDIFPINSENAFRIDFFDTEIETIKIFDITSQKGTKAISEIKICPCTDLFYNFSLDSSGEIKKVESEISKLKTKSTADVDLSVIFSSQIDDICSKLELGSRDYSLSVIYPYFDNFNSTIFDYLDISNSDKNSKNDFVIVFEECKQVYDYFVSSYNEISERINELSSTGINFAGDKKYIFDTKFLLDKLSEFVCVAFLKITNSNRLFESKAVFNYKTIPSNRYTHNLKDFSIEIKSYLMRKYKIYILCSDSEQVSGASEILSSHGISYNVVSDVPFDSSGVFIVSAGYESGFILPEEKICVIGTYDIFAKKKQTNSLKAGRGNSYNIPKVGDYVVHEVHGIGIFEGVTKLSGNFGTKDYAVVKYRDGDTLYVPTTHMDLLAKFVGSDAPKKLSKIGGADFSAVKERVRSSIKKLAFDLIELYAKRDTISGYAFSEDNDLQREFENSFPYTETEDQLSSIEEVKHDMEKPKVMDRLICGDVGFGKTEVALRASFKAIMDGKQVAFIAPTTILSEQHYNTARSRMYNFGVSIEVLNRFKTKKQVDKILQGIADGSIDLVCGTHRVLSSDVEFKNLGLIVLDEEQKFGVEDKEKLKNKYPEVDVLTLSATPIPRTLSMSLSGIRDISVIVTPPSERLPIQTYITEYTDALVSDAVARELARDGQVFILFNSVEKIYGFADHIRKICPDASVAVAHGQMPSRELEKVIVDFYNRQSNVLICTTIIENGVNIENANTLIVIDADKLGLAQLYQIRGRVGRGFKMAYAYFTYKYEKMLSEEAFKRLDALSEFCDFGSGYKLAMRDLEIRGGGNILGAEQSGHLQKIGYDMYNKILSETIKELRGEKVEQTTDVLMRVALDAYVPDTYVATSEDRMVVYKRISTVSSVEDVEKLKTELRQNYGEIPKEVLSLIDISLVRRILSKLNAVSVTSFGGVIDVEFKSKDDLLGSSTLTDAIFKFKQNCQIDISSKPILRFSREVLCSENFAVLKKFLIFHQELTIKKQK